MLLGFGDHARSGGEGADTVAGGFQVMTNQPRNVTVVFHGEDGLFHGCIVAEGGRLALLCRYHTHKVHTNVLQDDETLPQLRFGNLHPK